jgi:hypothetical protein
MGARWDNDLYLLTAKELQALPPWTVLTDITGYSTTASEVDINDQDGFDFSGGCTAWGVPVKDYVKEGVFVVLKDGGL